MKWCVHAIGRPALEFARSGIGEYEKRLRRFLTCQITFHKTGPDQHAESLRLLDATKGTLRFVLDERGVSASTSELRALVDTWEMEGRIKTISVLIGGADGHIESVRKSADVLFAISPMTIQHELALLIMLEQIYRVYSLKRGEPYHR